MDRSIAISIVLTLQLIATLAQAQVGPITCVTHPNGAQECRAPDGTIVPPPSNGGGVRPPSQRPPRPRPPRPDVPPPHRPPPTRPDVPPPRPIPSYGLQQFEHEEREVLSWNQRYLQAPYGSYEQTYARQQLDYAVSRAVQTVQGPYIFDGLGIREVETFALGIHQKYLQAPYQGVVQSFYRQVYPIGFAQFNRLVELEAQYLSYDSHQLHALANTYDSKYLQAAYQSAPQQAYDKARRALFGALPNAVMQEAYRLYSFRDVENLALHYDDLYLRAPYQSLAQQTYSQIGQQLFNEAKNRFQTQGRYEDLYRLQDEYNRKYLQAPYGSRKQNYYQQIRDLARQMLGGR